MSNLPGDLSVDQRPGGTESFEAAKDSQPSDNEEDVRDSYKLRDLSETTEHQFRGIKRERWW